MWKSILYVFFIQNHKEYRVNKNIYLEYFYDHKYVSSLCKAKFPHLSIIHLELT